MRAAAVPELMIQVFCHYYEQLVQGATGYIGGEEASPVLNLPSYQQLTAAHQAAGQAALDKTVVIKLNGGLGTSMGIQGAKSLLPAKAELSFLDIIVQQTLHLRQTWQVRLPLVLMNSFNTEVESLAALATYPEFAQTLPVSFLQHKEPKILKEGLSPAVWSADPNKEWCPPGHGDIYAALMTSQMLPQLLAAGFEYAFVSNADNLGAMLDLSILGYLAEQRLPFLMEVADRTLADRKGGHLAQRPDGQLVLRELAQCPPDELEAFQDIERYQYFNTNNLWIHLPTLHTVLVERAGVLGLPLIRNEKPVDPTDLSSPRVYQLETAMGSAIACFPGAQALAVPRERFLPVKKNNDLLVLWSDVYTVDDAYHLVMQPARNTAPFHGAPLLFLDDRYYQLIDDMRERFPYGAPSLLACTELHVKGNVYFGRNVTIKGKVHIVNHSDTPLWIEEGSCFADQTLEHR
ncbi:MAG: UTP--glucose-1-phosphate uridylyltransferase [Caldilineaceae bacterium]|nr:UTP--glucose-1-phosphate uridylyltransferase [Caldilineaceae bacterium]